MKTSALNLDTVRGTVQVAYDGVQHQPNLLVLTDEEIENLDKVTFEVGDVIDASSIKRAFTGNCCCKYLKNWLKDGGDDVIIGGVTFKADGTQEGLAINYESIDWPGSEEEIILGDGSRMTIEDFAEDDSFSLLYVEQTGNANDIMLGNNTAITIANLENRIVSDKNLVNKSVTDTLASDIEDLLETTQDIYSKITGLGNQLTTIDGKVASNTQKISNNTNQINALRNTVNGLSETVSEMNNTIAGLDNMYVSKTGDTMSGELVVANSNYRTRVSGGGILVWDRNTSATAATLIGPHSITSKQFILVNGNSDQILLGDGTTTSLSQITSSLANYLPLTGGTLTGDVDVTNATMSFVRTGEGSTDVQGNRVTLTDEANTEQVSIYCSDGVFEIYNDNQDAAATIVCGGVQIPNATDGKLVMATGQTNSLYGLCGGHIHSTTGQEATLYKKVYSTGFLNIYDIFGEEAIDNTVTSGRLNAEQSEVIREMYICNIMPTNIYYRFGDNSVATETSQYIPVGCRRGFAMDTYIFYFMQPTMQGMQIVRITVSIPDATSTLSWTKEVNDITISA